MSRRKKLPMRRRGETIKFEFDGQRYHATIGFYDDGKPGEVFLNCSGKAGSHSDMAVSEAAIAISIAIQHGAKLKTLREACLRKSSGEPSTAIGAILDIMDEGRPLKIRRVMCDGCGVNYADQPSSLCVGCQAYKEHQA